MSVPESFEDLEFNLFATGADNSVVNRDPSNPNQGWSPSSVAAEKEGESSFHNPTWGWQDQLLPVSAIRQEEDKTVLRQELETAHHLLEYQQQLICSLTEQLSSRETHLVQVENDLETAKQRCMRQAENVSDVEAVCHDLRIQLRRQQERLTKQLSQRDFAPEQQHPSSSISSTVSPTGEEITPFNEESGALQAKLLDTKVPPVPTWSATSGVDLAGPLTIYRQLAEVRTSKAAIRRKNRRYVRQSRGPQIWQQSRRSPAKSSLSPSTSAARVELPSFARS